MKCFKIKYVGIHKRKTSNKEKASSNLLGYLTHRSISCGLLYKSHKTKVASKIKVSTELKVTEKYVFDFAPFTAFIE